MLGQAECVQQSATEAKDPEQVDPLSNTDKDDPYPYIWMTKPCGFYKEEYKDCKSFKERFNQYFIYGEMQDCAQWNEDYNNCRAWNDAKDKESLEKLVASEKNRVRTRLQNHYRNNVWENRETPPEDWNKELPPEIMKEYEGSYLLAMKNDLENGVNKPLPLNDKESESSCCVM
ncbi:unnamed protein product [Allacma fusca]|uniref:Synaptic plasticity regulator PANTS n=1 Tax=Allacma fusca TaxID=39272 RepID=A0A8J2IY12_9HEXA|nr:unnamed protein product [Allacma fusca]